ncbi:MAG: CYTH domain-containing protein [Gammaproteobacteria bacterium]|nr:CYTH domain-containing protein [Gammaproteobacteria bacterium]MBP7912013.1 CYTH domain-containing protein [Pseudomonadales bacterium]
MTVEIERKFLVADTGCLADLEGERLSQGYIASTGRATVRVRICGARAWLTLKGRTEGISRREFEYPIPLAHAEVCIADLCTGPVIEKTRYRVAHNSHIWEVDVFHGDNEGLVLAEIELTREDECFACPPWLGAEVSGDPRYYNSNLALRPYRSWA